MAAAFGITLVRVSLGSEYLQYASMTFRSWPDDQNFFHVIKY